MLFREQKESRSEKNSIDFSGNVKKMEFCRRWSIKMCLPTYRKELVKVKFTKEKEKLKE